MTHKAYIDATNYPDVKVEIPISIERQLKLKRMKEILCGTVQPIRRFSDFWIREIPEFDKEIIGYFSDFNSFIMPYPDGRKLIFNPRDYGVIKINEFTQ